MLFFASTDKQRDEVEVEVELLVARRCESSPPPEFNPIRVVPPVLCLHLCYGCSLPRFSLVSPDDQCHNQMSVLRYAVSSYLTRILISKLYFRCILLFS